MIIQFKVGNFLSFKDEVTFSMVGYPPIKEHEGEGNFHNTNYSAFEKIKLLKSAVLYGSNGSGKSNLLSAMSFCKKFMITSTEGQTADEINVLKFLLSSEMDNEPSFFEIIFVIDDIRYRYGFEVDTEKVHSEWLFSLKNSPHAKETQLFIREFQEIKINSRSFKEGKGVENKTRINTLFLSAVGQWDGDIAEQILTWFRFNFNIISGLDDTTTSYTVKKFVEDTDFKNTVIQFFKNIEIGFENIEIIENSDLMEAPFKNVPDELSNEAEELITALQKFKTKINKDIDTKKMSIFASHKRFNNAQKFSENISFDFSLESKGTIKIFSLLGPIIDTIQKGKVLIIDELDSRLHTLLTMELIKFFHHKNNKKAQLIFASHDTNLLRKEIFRRDQIWFTEKDNFGATDLYSLIEYKVNQARIRNDASFEKDYLIGRYGAIPFLGNIQQFIQDFLYEYEQKEKETA